MAALTVNVVPADGGERLVAGPVVHRVLEDGTSTGGRLGLLQGRYPPGWTGPPPHLHREHEETFHVLGGAVRFTSGAAQHVLGPEDCSPRRLACRTGSATPPPRSRPGC